MFHSVCYQRIFHRGGLNFGATLRSPLHAHIAHRDILMICLIVRMYARLVEERMRLATDFNAARRAIQVACVAHEATSVTPCILSMYRFTRSSLCLRPCDLYSAPVQALIELRD